MKGKTTPEFRAIMGVIWVLTACGLASALSPTLEYWIGWAFLLVLGGIALVCVGGIVWHVAGEIRLALEFAAASPAAVREPVRELDVVDQDEPADTPPAGGDPS